MTFSLAQKKIRVYFAFKCLVQDLRGGVEKMASFLGKSVTEEQLVKLTEHLRFDNFAKNGAVNNEIGKQFGILNQSGNFIRKGLSNRELLNLYNLDNWISRLR